MRETQVIDGRQLAADLCIQLTEQISQLPRPPVLKVILVGDDPASVSYVKSKTRTAKQVGIDAETVRLPVDSDKWTLIKLIHDLNHDDMVDGIMVQLPLPSRINQTSVLNAISPVKDVDGLSPYNCACHRDISFYVPCTPMGIMKLLKSVNVSLQGAKALVVGNGIVGRPTALLLAQADATVTSANIYTRDLPAECSLADVLIVAVGSANLIRGDWIKPGAVIIDVGFNHTTSGLCGDVVYEECLGIAEAITPVPGGVGPMTIACLLENTVQASRRLALS
jgi:methylenetetrahydrofolate dehydrogenase (NADP+)/methenyltetrahydrofolate cyclohydrolase